MKNTVCTQCVHLRMCKSLGALTEDRSRIKAQMVLSVVMAVRRFENLLASRARSVAMPKPNNGVPRRMVSDGRVVDKPAREQGSTGLWTLLLLLLL